MVFCYVGRPYGGCGILYRKSLSPYVKTLHTGLNRFCSIKLCDSVGTSFLLICVYLPTDFQSSFTDYLNTLGELEGFIDSQSFDHIFISGDFNVDFDRGGDNAQLLWNFMDNYYLVAADLNFRSAIHFTYERDDCAVPSWPDRIICSMSMVNLVSKFDQGVNLSGHYLLIFNFKVFFFFCFFQLMVCLVTCLSLMFGLLSYTTFSALKMSLNETTCMLMS